MGFKIRIGLLTCLVAAAAYSSLAAYRSIAPSGDGVPEEVYARFEGREEDAQFFLRSFGDFVAVYGGRREKEPVSVTKIELDNLRSADRAMVKKGIPAADQAELLRLLEDLGS